MPWTGRYESYSDEAELCAFGWEKKKNITKINVEYDFWRKLENARLRYVIYRLI